jgi:hypothetical protein
MIEVIDALVGQAADVAGSISRSNEVVGGDEFGRWVTSTGYEPKGAIVSDFILVPGAGGIATPYWRLVSAQLRRAGHRALPVDLPGASPGEGLAEYAVLVAGAIEDCVEPVVVAQSMGGFSAVMACGRARPRGRVLVNAMVPAPGETPGEWWEARGGIDARVAAAKSGGYSADFDLATYSPRPWTR